MLFSAGECGKEIKRDEEKTKSGSIDSGVHIKIHYQGQVTAYCVNNNEGLIFFFEPWEVVHNGLYDHQRDDDVNHQSGRKIEFKD